MTQLQLYKYATYGLVILNLSILTFFIVTKHSNGRKAPNSAKHDLKLDKPQQILFKQSADIHAKVVKSIDEQQQQLLQSYFQTLIDTINQIDKEAIFYQIKTLEQQKIEATYQHFKEIKSMLKEEQYDNFESFMNRLLKRILPRSKKRSPLLKGF